MSIRETIIKLLEEVNFAVVDDDEPFQLDSLGFIAFIVALEDEFDIEFPDDFLGIQNVLTVSSMVVVVGNLLDNCILT